MPQARSGSTNVRRLDRNIETLLARREQEARSAPLEDRVAEHITRFAGSMVFVYLHAITFALWILVNVGLITVFPRFDPTLVILAMVASVEAIFLSTFVMISQNRMAEADDKRADLNLQISLLAEHEATQLLAIVSGIAKELGVKVETTDEIGDLTKEINPEEVLDALEKSSR